MTTVQYVSIFVLAVLVFWGVGAYNRLVRLRNVIANSFAQIDVQLKRRYDLIPNLVEVARKYAAHERETLEAVTAARNQAKSAADVARSHPAAAGAVTSLAVAEQVLTGAMGRLMAVVEAYPELKADQSLRELAEELTSTENKISFARQLFNDATLDYNNAAQQFPTNLMASMFGFREAAMMQATTSEAERAPVRVQL
ncbi:LemA family protein [Piscinibacter sp. HJYY11]|uniref:LemA family protein n=1 Tax=Piscinibacter sp. HJYY11 TaxID=2801333 RepID=UPI00191D7AAD|nr:LemA family protein [Piscinibacter sp. HJYY11]MBL0729512.1 LemA family protein [Piscinibacter sp. HJYY11]